MQGIRDPSPSRGVADTTWHTAKVSVPVDDNDIEGCRRCDGGDYSFKEIRCGVCGIN